MVYALAAYTLTIGVLALYGLTIRHRERAAVAEWARAASRPSEDGRGGFNVGASLLAPLWMWAHGLRLPGALLLVPWLALVPLAAKGLWTPFLFVAAVPVAAGAALGFVGNRIAAEYHGRNRAPVTSGSPGDSAEPSGAVDPAVLSASQLPWALAGITLYAFVLPWAAYFWLG